jgi:hypothetical protein
MTTMFPHSQCFKEELCHLLIIIEQDWTLRCAFDQFILQFSRTPQPPTYLPTYHARPISMSMSIVVTLKALVFLNLDIWSRWNAFQNITLSLFPGRVHVLSDSTQLWRTCLYSFQCFQCFHHQVEKVQLRRGILSNITRIIWGLATVTGAP